MKIAIIQFPKAFCCSEIAQAVVRAGMEPIIAHQNTENLNEMTAYILPSFEIDEIQDNSLSKLLQVQSALGKPILGIGKSAKFLADHGLVPGLLHDQVGIYWEANTEKEIAEHICLTPDYQYNAFTRLLTAGQVLPISPFEISGRFVIPCGLLAEMRVQGLNLFDYVMNSPDQIAAVSNKLGNVMAIIPSIELTTTIDFFLQSMRAYILQGFVEQVEPLFYVPRKE